MQLQSFLDMIAYSELGPQIVSNSDNGYNVLVGSTPDQINTFPSYADHPNILVTLQNGIESTAAGRYQILHRYFEEYKEQLNLPDFGHASQDCVAVQMIRECLALDDVSNGYIESAIYKCRSRWASLPGADYANQHMQSMTDLLAAFRSFGGIVMPQPADPILS